MSLEDKHELYQEHLRRPHTHYSELANWAKITFNLSTTPAKSTICNAIKRNHTKSQRVDAKARTMDRNVALPQVEAKIVEWVLQCEELGVCITEELIRKQATTIAIELAIPETQRIKFAKGWLYKFERKHGFRSMIQHGEAASVPPEQVQEGRKKVLHETSGYNSSDIYNMDETAFFFCLSPHRSITRNCLPGTKKSKKRITVALTTNADVSDLPQDAGIIASFKAKVKQLQLQNALEQINSVMTGRQDKLYEVSMLEAMGWARDAWRS
ncbi:hypothetical protein DYB30_006377, partial [Aphanomyces astaci]